MRRAVVAILIVLILIVLFFIGRHIPFGAGNSIFHVESTDRITHIVISEENISVRLQRRNNDWYVNGEYPARPQAIDLMLKTVKDVRIKSPVTDKMYNEILESDYTRKVEVKIYDKRKVIQSYYVYTGESAGYPCIMQKGKNTKPFIVNIPGYGFDPCKHFVADQKFWMPYTVFELRPDQIAEIQLTYYETPDSSFRIIRKDKAISFISKSYNNESLDTMATGRYLSYFNYVPFENWTMEMGIQKLDSITGRTPYFNLIVISDKADTTELVTWRRWLKEEDVMIEDTDRLLGSLNRGNNLFLIKYYHLDPLIKQPSYFIID